MTKGIFHSQNPENNNHTRVTGTIRSVLLFCTLLLSFSVRANNLPSFVNGFSQSFSVCQNSPASSINSLLAINDADAGQTESWTIFSSPLHGTLGGFPTSVMSIGSIVIPAGLDYTPATGYFGNDTFTIEIFDGTDTATTTVVVTVNALPTLNSGLIAPSVCDGTIFSYTPTSASTGATFAWSRPFIGGIANPAATGTGNPMETLVSATYYNIVVTYNYTIVAGGCTNHQNVAVTVKPTPRLSSNVTNSSCSGGTFNYAPTSSITGTTDTWTRASVTGITPATGSGAGNISEALVNSTSAPLTATYSISLTANGCTSVRNITVDVNPQPAVTTITTTSGSSVCSGTNNQNFGAGIAPPTGVTYNWSAINAIISATSANGQYTIVNFPNAGNAVIKLNCTISGSGCVTTDTFTVNVGTGVSSSDKILFYNQQFIYLDNNIETYQWGYDDASTLAPSTLAGETFQSYPNSSPDFANKYYWVKTTKNGCKQKTFYNAPMAVANITTGAATMEVFPNPASNTLSVNVNGSNGNVVTVAITNMLGQTIKTQSGTMHDLQFNIADLASGCYLVVCSENGIKSATARFIKN